MWLVECNNHGHGSPFSATPTPCSCLHNPNIPAWNQVQPLHGVSADYGGRREISSTRWNPTPEQLQALEDMYRRGMRTPSAEKIQQIASKLRRFGRIEGKNVFYWFQNHKARERQKKRRQTEVFAGKKIPHVENQEGKRSGFRLEAEHPDNYNWPAPSNCNTSSEYSASMHGAGVVVEEECKQDEWTHLLQHQKSTQNYWPLDLSFTAVHQKNPGQENAKSFSAINFNKLLQTSKDDDDDEDDDLRVLGSNQTLQLFPVGSDANEEKGCDFSNSRGAKLANCNQFFEFLPIKN